MKIEHNKAITIGSTVLAAVAGATSAAADGAWQGAYGGLSFGQNSGLLDYSSCCYDDAFMGSNAGAFVGFNVQSGNIVYGAELAYTFGNMLVEEDISHPTMDYAISNMIDLKGRIGYAMGDILVYGFAGYSFGTMYDDYYGSANASGFSYGAGAEYAITDDIMIGVEYIARNITDNGGYLDARPMSTVSLRAGFRF